MIILRCGFPWKRRSSHEIATAAKSNVKICCVMYGLLFNIDVRVLILFFESLKVRKRVCVFVEM